MADDSTFLFLSFLFYCCPPFLSASTKQQVERIAIPPHVDAVRYNETRLPKLGFLSLSYTCLRTLPGNVLSDLSEKCQGRFPEKVLNQTQQFIKDCACEFLRSYPAPPNSTACAEMLESCGTSAAAIAVGVSLLLLLLACGVGCVWHWRRDGIPRFGFPRFLRRRSSRRKDFTKALSVSPHVISSRYKVSVQTQDHRPTARKTDLCDSYENLEGGLPRSKEADQDLYENTQQCKFEDHIYGNEGSSDYYNFQKPAAPDASQEDDVYILPDSY